MSESVGTLNQWKTDCGNTLNDLKKNVNTLFDKSHGVDARIDRLNLDLLAVESGCGKSAIRITNVDNMFGTYDTRIDYLGECIAKEGAALEQNYSEFRREFQDLVKEVDQLRLGRYGRACSLASERRNSTRSIASELNLYEIEFHALNFILGEVQKQEIQASTDQDTFVREFLTPGVYHSSRTSVCSSRRVPALPMDL